MERPASHETQARGPVPGAPGEPPETECVAGPEGLAALSGAWSDLMNRDPAAHVFQSHTWLFTWLRFHPSACPRVIVARRGDQLTAALPLYLQPSVRGVPGARRLRLVGDNDSDYCDALCDPAHPEDVRAVWGHLSGQRDWGLLDLRYVPAGGHLARLAGSAGKGVRIHRQHQDIAPYLEIPDGWRQRLARPLRDTIGRCERRIREQGVVSFDRARSPEDVDRMLEQFAELHAARWERRGQTSVFRFAAYRAWLGAACRELLKEERLYLYRLALDGAPISMGLYFLHGRRLLGYMAALSTEHAKLSPGHLLEARVIDDTRQAGLADVDDFGRGGEAYKLRWSPHARVLEWILVARPRPLALGAFWWSARAMPLIWRHYRLGTAAREVRRRLALRREA